VRWRERRRRAACQQGEPPELYWVRRGERVIGAGSLEELLRSRQVETYRAIHGLVADLGPVPAVFDIGCNTAALGRLLEAWGYPGRLWGLDRNPHALRRARRELGPSGRAPGGLVVGNARALPLGDRSVPVVVLKDVLEHLEDFRPVLGEALRVAERAAIVACFVPWVDGAPQPRRDPRGFYENAYARAEVLGFAEQHGWRPDRSIRVDEGDGRPNEVVRFRPLSSSRPGQCACGG